MKKALFPAALLAGLLALIYGALWFWMVERVRAEAGELYNQGIASGMIRQGAPPEVSGFPGPFKVRFAGLVRVENQDFLIPDLTVSSFFLPGLPLSIELTDGIARISPVTDIPDLWQIDSASAEIVIPQTFPASALEPDIRDWQEKGGQIDLRSLSVHKKNLLLSGEGSFVLDQDLQPMGTLDIAVSGHMEFLELLKQAGLIKDKSYAITAAVMGALTKDGVMNAPVAIRNRIVWIGPVKAASLPAIEWPRPALPDTRNQPAPPR